MTYDPNHPSPPYPTEDELKATRAPAIVAFLILLATLIAICVMAALNIAGVIAPGPWYLVVFFGGIVAAGVIALVASRKPRGRARNLTGHPPTTAHNILSSDDPVDLAKRVVDRINHEERQ